MKNLCFVLGSGGSRGIAHVGFLKAMEENGIKPDCIIGCSMGSVVGACYANGMSLDDMKVEIDKLNVMDIVDLSPFALSRGGLLESNKMRKVLTKLLNNVNFSDLKIDFKCVATDIISGKLITLDEGLVSEAVQASSSIPTIFKPVKKDGMLLIDGGTISRVPIKEAYSFNAKTIIAIDVLGDLKDYDGKTDIINQTLRIVDVVDTYISSEYYEKYKCDLLLKPELGNMSQYKVKNLDFAYDMGYKMGIENVQKIKEIVKSKEN